MEEERSPCRRWEEMNVDLLLEIFRRLGLIDLLAISLVCKQWRIASRDPSCWRSLDFDWLDPLRPPIEWGTTCTESISGIASRYSRIMNNVIATSQRSATHLRLSSTSCFCFLEFDPQIKAQAVTFLLNECPKLKHVELSLDPDIQNLISNGIGRWKDLESLIIEGSFRYLGRMLAQISRNCPNFTSLCLRPTLAVDNSKDSYSYSAIARHLPGIKELSLYNCVIERNSLLEILEACRSLVRLSLEGCRCSIDDEILASTRTIEDFTLKNMKRGLIVREEEDEYGLVEYEYDLE